MLTRRAYDYVFTGVLHWHFQTINAGSEVHAAGDQAGVVSQLGQYVSSLAALDFSVTANAVATLQGVRDRLAELPEGSLLDQDTAAQIQRVTAGAQQALYSEASSRQVFVPTEKRFPV